MRRRVRETIIAMEEQKILKMISGCVSPFLSSMQSACVVLYFYPWPALLYHIFRNYLINRTVF
jgi:hypothetical protein